MSHSSARPAGVPSLNWQQNWQQAGASIPGHHKLPGQGVREGGVEPPRPFGHRILSPARLPGSATLALCCSDQRKRWERGPEAGDAPDLREAHRTNEEVVGVLSPRTEMCWICGCSVQTHWATRPATPPSTALCGTRCRRRPTKARPGHMSAGLAARLQAALPSGFEREFELQGEAPG
jgi:hypothetical protein